MNPKKEEEAAITRRKREEEGTHFRPVGAAAGAATSGGTGGIAKDAKQAGAAIAKGRVLEGVDSVARGAVTGTVAAFGGEPAARATRIALNSKIGKKVTRGLSWGVIVSSAATPLALLLILIMAISSISVVGNGAAIAAACTPGSGSAMGGLENPTREQVAGTLYAQAMGLGLGETAALIAIGVGYGETGLQNDTDGDCWSGDCAGLGHTSSRGVFQQFGSWPPEGAFSGLYTGNWGHPNSGAGASAPRAFNQFNGSNAWGANGWARNDPRMNVAQAANMFLLGPDYGPTMGLEDNSLFQANKTASPTSLSASTLVTIAQQVQQFPVAHMGSYQQNMQVGKEYFEKIRSGQIPVPDFVSPMPGMFKSATTPETKRVIAGLSTTTTISTPSPSPSPTRGGGNQGRDDEPEVEQPAAASSEPNGLLLLGDSIMEGVSTEGEVPREIYGKTVISRTQVGITTKAAIDKWESDISAGPNRILISLGSNDAGGSPFAYSEQIARVMKLATSSREVFWFSLHYEPASTLNRALKDMAARYPNLTVVNVNDQLTKESGLLYPSMNYLHPNPDGYKAMWSTAFNALQGASQAGGLILSNAACVGFSFGAGGGNPLAAAALAFATDQIGKPYGYPQGNPPTSWDCSKLTGGSYNYAWEQAGKPKEYAYFGAYPFLPRASLSYDQYRSGHFQFLPLEQALPGDFIWFNGDLGMSSGNPIDHVALIYNVEEKTLIEAGDPVNVNSYMDNLARSGGGRGIVGPPKADGSPTLPGEPGWQPVVGRPLPVGVDPEAPNDKGSVTAAALVVFAARDEMSRGAGPA